MSTTEPPTIVLEKSEISLFQHLDGAALPCLILYSGPDAGRRIDLDSGFLILGRSPEAQVRIDSPGLSRRHAELQVFGHQVVLKDLGSANGSHVNGTRVEGAVALKDGDLLRVANVLLRFHDAQSVDALLHDRIYRLATVDEGTGAFNRKYLADVLEKEVARARRGVRPLAVVVYDLDHFKAVNDTWGHAAGDQVLRECTARVRGELRTGEALCRMGGEEFLVLMPGSNAAQAAGLAQRLRDRVASEPFVISAGPAGSTRQVRHSQTISLGVAEWTPVLTDGRDLLEQADRRLYAAKRGGRDRVQAG
jgi:diguanylate cyclase (GGDEF)-like protein